MNPQYIHSNGIPTVYHVLTTIVMIVLSDSAYFQFLQLRPDLGSQLFEKMHDTNFEHLKTHIVLED